MGDMDSLVTLDIDGVRLLRKRSLGICRSNPNICFSGYMDVIFFLSME